MLAHVGSTFFSGGFIGVDVFFVLSGYLITRLLLSEISRTGRLSYSNFYTRRLKRLMPALVAMLLIVSVVAHGLLSTFEARLQLSSGPFAATWTSNFYFLFKDIDYFDELSGRDLYLHTWSLGVEEQFYLLWPVLIFTLLGLNKKLSIANKNQNNVFVSWFFLLFIAPLIGSLYISINDPHTAFYMMPTRIWQFSIGALIAIYNQRKIYFHCKLLDLGDAKFSRTLALVGLFLIVGSAVLLKPTTQYLAAWIIIPSIGAGLIIIAGHGLSKTRSSPLAFPLLVWLGDRSYSMYLWHWPIFMLGASVGLANQVYSYPVLILICISIAHLSYKYLELPFWKGRASHVTARKFILSGLLVMFSTAAIQYNVLITLRRNAATVDMSINWRGDVPDIYRFPCDSWYSSAEVEPCVVDSGNASKTVVFFGDSIGAQWYSMIPYVFPPSDWRIVVITKSSCPIVDEDYYYPRIGRVFKICSDWRDAAIEYILDLKPDTVLIGSASTYDFDANQWVEGSIRVVEKMANEVESIVLLAGTPSLGFDGPGCVSRNVSVDGIMDHEACQAEHRLNHVRKVTMYLQKAADISDNVQLLDLNDLICPDEICNALSHDGVVVFRDGQHLTDSFVRSRSYQIKLRFNEIHYLPNKAK
jgi:peptidoglycan/LPS O-acetylase OafA/YrhL